MSCVIENLLFFYIVNGVILFDFIVKWIFLFFLRKVVLVINKVYLFCDLSLCLVVVVKLVMRFCKFFFLLLEILIVILYDFRVFDMMMFIDKK